MWKLDAICKVDFCHETRFRAIYTKQFNVFKFTFTFNIKYFMKLSANTRGIIVILYLQLIYGARDLSRRIKMINCKTNIKKGSKSERENYHPTAILPTLSKLLKRIIFSKL